MSEQGVSMSVSFESREAEHAIGSLIGRVADLEPVFDDIGAAMVTATQQRFEDERGPDGKPWRGLAPATLKQRAAKRRGRKGTPRILRDESDLYDSLTHDAKRGEARWGSHRVYARIHQLGGNTGRGRSVYLHPRPFLGISEADKQEIAHIASDHLKGAV